ncbi:MAG TPA: hypothetical protein ENJ26_02680 [Rhodobacteraceae bacterium]|nr:hypothetical protein [Paracoccaceae bacterium]
MPFLRLVIIYIVVIMAAVLFFQRDAVMGMLGLSFADDEPEAVAMAPAASEESTPGTTAKAPVTGTEPETTQQMQTPVATAGETSVPTQAVAEQPAQTANAPQPLQTPVAEQQPAAETPATAAPPPSASGDTIAAGLEAARRAYWAGDQAGAETAYLELVEKAPENADVLGELGNLYYAQRRYSAAAEYYHRAGLQLLKDGDKGRVNALVGVLQSIAPQKAADLRARLNQ